MFYCFMTKVNWTESKLLKVFSSEVILLSCIYSLCYRLRADMQYQPNLNQSHVNSEDQSYWTCFLSLYTSFTWAGHLPLATKSFAVVNLIFYCNTDKFIQKADTKNDNFCLLHNWLSGISVAWFVFDGQLNSLLFLLAYLRSSPDWFLFLGQPIYIKNNN